jgi:hypothetical protein
MAQRFAQTDGDIRATLETLFFSPEFWDEHYFGAKFETPYDYVISAVRVTGAPEITNYRPLLGTMTPLGMAPYAHETPDGYANTREAWLNPDAMMTRLSFATALGQGHLPLLAPPFQAGGGAPFRVKFKNGGGGGAKMYELNPPEDGSLRKGAGPDNGPPMNPPEPTQLWRRSAATSRPARAKRSKRRRFNCAPRSCSEAPSSWCARRAARRGGLKNGAQTRS